VWYLGKRFLLYARWRVAHTSHTHWLTDWLTHVKRNFTAVVIQIKHNNNNHSIISSAAASDVLTCIVSHIYIRVYARKNANGRQLYIIIILYLHTSGKRVHHIQILFLARAPFTWYNVQCPGMGNKLFRPALSDACLYKSRFAYMYDVCCGCGFVVDSDPNVMFEYNIQQ